MKHPTAVSSPTFSISHKMCRLNERRATRRGINVWQLHAVHCERNSSITIESVVKIRLYIFKCLCQKRSVRFANGEEPNVELLLVTLIWKRSFSQTGKQNRSTIVIEDPVPDNFFAVLVDSRSIKFVSLCTVWQLHVEIDWLAHKLVLTISQIKITVTWKKS